MTVPPGFLGSISHKDNIGVALVAKDSVLGDDGEILKGVGIDIEKATARKKRIERKVLTPNEREKFGRIEGISRDEEVLLRFSLKESVTRQCSHSSTIMSAFRKQKALRMRMGRHQYGWISRVVCIKVSERSKPIGEQYRIDTF